MRAAMCVVVRDLIVFGVLQDMMRGRPAVYATFSSYDEVAHHSGLERADTLEALRKLDQQFGRIDRARRFAPRPYEIVVLSDHGQTQGATFKQRNGYALEELVNARSRLEASARSPEATSRARWSGMPSQRQREPPVAEPRRRRREERCLRQGRRRPRLGKPRPRLSHGGAAPDDARGDRPTAPGLIPTLRGHPHVGWILVRSSEHGAVALGANGATTSPRTGSRASTRLQPSRRRLRSTCCVPTGSSMSPTS